MKKSYAWFGLAAPLFYAATVILGGALRPGYSHLLHAVSELTSPGAPNKGLLDALFAVYNAMLILFGVLGALRLGGSTPKTVRAALLLLAVTGLLGILMWFFPMDARNAAPTARGAVHWILAGILSPSTIAAPFLVWIGLRKHPGARAFAVYSLISAVVILITGGVTALGAAMRFDYFGLVERMTAGAFEQWVFGIAWGLLHRWGIAVANRPR